MVSLLAAPFVALYVRAQRQFARALAHAAVPERLQVNGNTSAVTTILERSFFLGGIVLASVIFLVFASPFVPTGPILAVVLVSVLVAGALLYRALARFQTKIDETVQAILTESPEARTAQTQLADLVRDRYPWAASTREVALPSHAVPTPVSIRRLHLRGRTGASIVTIHRGERAIYAPPPDTHLLPGDRLVLIGEEHQLEAAERLLTTDVSPSIAAGPSVAPSLAEVEVPEGSQVAGKTLAAIRLPDRAGATILGIERGDQAIPNPSPTEVVLAGDRLVLLATPDQLARVQDLVRRRDPGPRAT